MKETEFTVYQALQRIQTFGSIHAISFPATSRAVAGFERVDELLEAIGHVALRPGLPGSAATEAKDDSLDDLWSALKAVSRTARTIAIDESGFDRKFTLLTDSQRDILATAESFIEHLQTPGNLDKFTAYDLPPGITATLQNYVQTIQSQLTGQSSDHQSATSETTRIRGHIKEAKEVIKKLDTSVRNHFHGDDVILTAWRTASRIHSTGRAAPADPATPASTPAS